MIELPATVHRARPLLIAGTLGVVAGGLLAAGIAHAPSRPWVWLVAYLVLVVGVTQILLTAGQMVLATSAVTRHTIRLECLLFNLGNAGVMIGTLVDAFVVVALGSLLIAAALAVFLFATRRAAPSPWLWGYRLLLLFVVLSALIGVALSRATG